jgi:cell division protein FtsW (lipid II flippase)
VILEGLGATLMAIAMVAAFLLIFGGVKLARRKEDRGRGLLMIGAAAVVVMNVLIWTV